MLLEMNFCSAELGKDTNVSIIIPENAPKPYKVIWLLHGLSGDNTQWLRYTSVERLANEYKVAVVMPSCDRGWYVNTAAGANYFDYVTKELPERCRSVFRDFSEKREDNIIAGVSMGGYGAVKAAITYPDCFGSCFMLSGALDLVKNGICTENFNEWRGVFGFELEGLEELLDGEQDVFFLAKRLNGEKKGFPRIYMWCGDDDIFIEANRNFDRLLSELGVEHTSEFSEGEHSWKWWELHIGAAFENILCSH